MKSEVKQFLWYEMNRRTFIVIAVLGALGSAKCDHRKFAHSSLNCKVHSDNAIAHTSELVLVQQICSMGD